MKVPNLLKIVLVLSIVAIVERNQETPKRTLPFIHSRSAYTEIAFLNSMYWKSFFLRQSLKKQCLLKI